MKTFFRIRTLGALALVITASAIVFSCAQVPIVDAWVPPEILTGKPVYTKHRVVEPRVRKISKEQKDLLDAALEKHDKSLFKVVTYKDGKPTGKPWGTLGCINHNALKIVNAEALKSGASNVAVQFGAKKARPGGGPTCYAQTVPRELESVELVKKVTPVLVRYAAQ